MAVTGSEWDLLKAIADLGGKTSLRRAGPIAGLSTDYGRIVGHGLGTADYIALRRSGKVEMTPKGWQTCRKKGWQPPEPDEDGKDGPGGGGEPP